MDGEKFTPEGAAHFVAPDSAETTEEKEQSEPRGEAAFVAVLEEAKVRFTEEFGPGVAEKLDSITGQMDRFMDRLRSDFQREHEYSGITPDDFITKYGLGTHVDGKSARGADISEYSLETQQKLKEEGKPWAIHSFSVPVFEKFDSKNDQRAFPYARQEWKPDEEHTETFTPIQEERLYELLTGSPDSVLEQAKRQNWHVAEFATKIPGMKIALHAESGPLNREQNKPIHKGVGGRNYGWKRRRSNLSFDKGFIEQVLNERPGGGA